MLGTPGEPGAFAAPLGFDRLLADTTTGTWTVDCEVVGSGVVGTAIADLSIIG